MILRDQPNKRLASTPDFLLLSLTCDDFTSLPISAQPIIPSSEFLIAFLHGSLVSHFFIDVLTAGTPNWIDALLPIHIESVKLNSEQRSTQPRL
jgi:hypothetical protein